MDKNRAALIQWCGHVKQKWVKQLVFFVIVVVVVVVVVFESRTDPLFSKQLKIFFPEEDV